MFASIEDLRKHGVVLLEVRVGVLSFFLDHFVAVDAVELLLDVVPALAQRALALFYVGK